MTLETIRWKPTDYEVVTDYDGSVSIRRSDGASIPTDPRNTDYYEFLQVEKADEKNEIKRTTLPEPEPTIDPLVAILEKITKIETNLSKVTSDVDALKAKEG